MWFTFKASLKAETSLGTQTLSSKVGKRNNLFTAFKIAFILKNICLKVSEFSRCFLLCVIQPQTEISKVFAHHGGISIKISEHLQHSN